MAVSVNAKPIQPLSGYGQGPAHQAPVSGPAGAAMPVQLFGTGTPNTGEPFSGAGVGSTYVETNATANNPNIWVKQADTNAIADWKLQGSTGVVVAMSELYDISASDSEQIVFRAVTASEILTAGLLWVEATDSAGADSGDITIGTATGGNQIVTAAAYGLSQATGDYQALTLVTGALAAGTSVFASHDTVAEAGTYRLQLKIRIEA